MWGWSNFGCILLFYFIFDFFTCFLLISLAGRLHSLIFLMLPITTYYSVNWITYPWIGITYSVNWDYILSDMGFCNLTLQFVNIVSKFVNPVVLLRTGYTDPIHMLEVFFLLVLSIYSETIWMITWSQGKLTKLKISLSADCLEIGNYMYLSWKQIWKLGYSYPLFFPSIGNRVDFVSEYCTKC